MPLCCACACHTDARRANSNANSSDPVRAKTPAEEYYSNHSTLTSAEPKRFGQPTVANHTQAGTTTMEGALAASLKYEVACSASDMQLVSRMLAVEDDKAEQICKADMAQPITADALTEHLRLSTVQTQTEAEHHQEECKEAEDGDED